MTNNRQPEKMYFSEPINLIPEVPSRYEPHWHKFTEILIYPPKPDSHDSPRISVDQNLFQMQPGDILFIWSSEMHSVEVNNDKSLIGLQFPANLLTDIPELASFSHLFRTYHLISYADPQMYPLAEYIQSQVQKIVELRSDSSSFHSVKELISVYEIFIRFGTHLKSTLLPLEISNKQGNCRTIDRINQACRYIVENCDKDLTLESIAEKAEFSACYFSRVFKQTMNCNFVEYLTMQRLKRAQSLLADTDLAITNIAMESGFRSISTFNRVFRKYKGCAPSEFKKHYFQQSFQ